MDLSFFNFPRVGNVIIVLGTLSFNFVSFTSILTHDLPPFGKQSISTQEVYIQLILRWSSPLGQKITTSLVIEGLTTNCISFLRNLSVLFAWILWKMFILSVLTRLTDNPQDYHFSLSACQQGLFLSLQTRGSKWSVFSNTLKPALFPAISKIVHFTQLAVWNKSVEGTALFFCKKIKKLSL